MTDITKTDQEQEKKIAEMEARTQRETELVIKKYTSNEELTDKEHVILLSYIVSKQTDQIDIMGRSLKSYEVAITELQHAIQELREVNDRKAYGFSESGIYVGES